MSTNFQLGIDLNKLLRDTEQAKQEMRSLGGTVEQSGSKINSSFNKIGAAIGGALSTAAIAAFGKKLIDVTGQFQTFQAVLENTFGSASKAKSSMDMIKDFAATTPFQVDELTGSFVKLANMGFAPTKEQMTSLGDLASSTGKGFGQLTEALIDAQVGEMERLKEFGIRAAKDGDKITFTFKEQQTVVENNASAIREYILSLGQLQGVQGANAKIAETLTGQMSNLQDSFTAMLNEIGSRSEGVLSGAMSGVNLLIENYEEVGKALGVLIATYGTYKAALLATIAIQKASAVVGNVQAFFQLAKAIKSAKDAQLLFNMVCKANPYVLLASVLVGAGAALYAFSKNANYAAKAQKALDESAKEMNKSVISEQRELARLKGELDGTKKGSEAYKKIKDEIVAKYGKYNSALDDEINKVGLTAEAYDNLSLSIQRSFGSRQYEKFAAEQMSGLDEIMADKFESLQKKFTYKYGDEQGSKLYAKMREGIYSGSIGAEYQENGLGGTHLLTGLDEELINAFTEKGWKASNIIQDIIEIVKAQKATEDTLHKARERFGISDVKSTNEENVDNVNPTTPDPIYSAELAKAKAKWELEKKEFAALKADKTATVAEYEGAEKELKAAEDAFKALGGDTSVKKNNNDFKDAENSANRLKEIMSGLGDVNADFEYELKLDDLQSQLSMTDDLNKKLEIQKEIRELMLKKEQDAIEVEKQKVLEQSKANGASTEQQQTIITTYETKKENVAKKYEQEGAQLTAETNAQQTQKAAEERQEELEAYKQYAEQLVQIERWKKEQIEAINNDKSLTDSERDTKLSNVDTIAQHDTDTIATELGIDSTAITDTMMQSIQGTVQLSLAEIAAQIPQLEKELKKLLKDKNADPKKIAKYVSLLAKARGEIDDANEDLNETGGGSAEDISKKYDKAKDVLGNVTSTVDNLQSAFGDMLGEAGNDAMNTIKTVSSCVVGIIDGVQKASVMGVMGIKSVEGASVILLIISLAIQAVMAIVNICQKYFSTEAKMNKLIDENNAKIEKLSTSYNKLRDAMEDSVGRDWFKASSKSIDELDKQIALLYDNADKAQTKADNRSNTFAGKKKRAEDEKERDDYLNEAYETEREYQEALKEWYEELATTNVKDLSSDLASQIVDGWRSGLDDMSNIWDDTLDDLMANMIEKQLALELEEIMKNTIDRINSSFNEGDQDTELSQADIEAIKAQYEADKALAEKKSEEYRKIMGELEESSQTATSKGLETLTQDQGDELNGRFTALQMIGAEALTEIKLLRETTTGSLTGINESLEMLSDIASDQLTQLKSININTALLSETNLYLKSIKNNTSKL